MTATTDVDLTVETDEVLAASLQRAMRVHRDGIGTIRVEAHEWIMAILSEEARRRDEWVASLST